MPREASVAGNPDGEITVVEFFDYNCSYRKHGLHDVVSRILGGSRLRRAGRARLTKLDRSTLRFVTTHLSKSIASSPRDDGMGSGKGDSDRQPVTLAVLHPLWRAHAHLSATV